MTARPAAPRRPEVKTKFRFDPLYWTKIQIPVASATAAAGLYFITQRKKRRVSSVSLNFMSSRGNVREFIKTVSSF
jgi:hypothetical protein